MPEFQIIIMLEVAKTAVCRNKMLDVAYIFESMTHRDDDKRELDRDCQFPILPIVQNRLNDELVVDIIIQFRQIYSHV